MSAIRTEHLAEGVTCILGDCREVLPTLPRVVAVVTDPPYRLERGCPTAGVTMSPWAAQLVRDAYALLHEVERMRASAQSEAE